MKCVRGKRWKRISACKPVRSFNLKPIHQCAAEAREKPELHCTVPEIEYRSAFPIAILRNPSERKTVW